MPNVVKYSTGTDPNTIKKGNVLVGINNVTYGPTSSTGYWNGYTPPTGGYTIYQMPTNTTDIPRVLVADNADAMMI